MKPDPWRAVAPIVHPPGIGYALGEVDGISEGHPSMSLKGNFAKIGLGEILQTLAVSHHSGTLRITCAGEEKFLYFSEGEIAFMSSASPESIRIGDILLRQGKITQEDLTQALALQERRNVMLGQVLADLGKVSKEDIQKALVERVREEIYDLFLWKDAEFEFNPDVDECPRALRDPSRANTRIAINPTTIIVEGMRRLEEWKIIETRLRSPDDIFTRAHEDAPAGLSADEAQAFELVDGTESVRELFKRAPMGRFELSKALFNLLSRGHIRPLTVAELLKAAEDASQTGDLSRAAIFLRFAANLEPEDPALATRLAETLARGGRHAEAEAAYLSALRLYREARMHAETVQTGEQLLCYGRPSREVLEALYQAERRLGEKEKTIRHGMAYAERLEREGHLEEAAQVLEECVGLDPENTSLRMTTARVWKGIGSAERAISHLESLAGGLEEKRRYEELLKVLRMIYEIDPKRHDIKQKSNNVLILRERSERHKQRRLILIIAVSAAFFILSAYPIQYEVRARYAYANAKGLEELGQRNRNYTRAREKYQEIVLLFGSSTKADDARRALERLKREEEKYLLELREREEKRRRDERTRLEMHKERLRDLLALAGKKEKEGDFEAAHRAYAQILKDFSRDPSAQDITLPLRITSDPAGAEVILGKEPVGQTPLVIRYRQGQTLEITIRRSGCEGEYMKVSGKSPWQLHFPLKRRPVAEYGLPTAVCQPVLPGGDHLYLPGRDGYVYAIRPDGKQIVWRRAVGEFGDLLGRIALHGESLYVGNPEGTFFRLSLADGGLVWQVETGQSILAEAAVSSDGTLVALGNTAGEVWLIATEGGEVKGRFQTEARIDAAPAFARSTLIVGSTDDFLYGLEVPGLAVLWRTEVSNGVTGGVVARDDRVYFGCGDGSAYAVDSRAGAVLWCRKVEGAILHPPTMLSEEIIFVSEKGVIASFNRGSGEPLWSTRVARGRVSEPLVSGGHLYVGTEDGEIVVYDLARRTRAWAHQAGAGILARPAIIANRLYVPCLDGHLIAMEILP